MAIQWELRTTGSDTNGGGFDTSATGTDRSQSDAAFVTYTDLVIGGTNTTATSAANPFGATSPGNIVNITGGTGFTVQRARVVSVAGVVATFDRALGTAASTGGLGKLGGGLATVAVAAAQVAAGDTVNVKAGTYTLTAVVTLNSVAPQSWIGYQTTHGDGGTKPLITTATNSTRLIEMTANAVAGHLWQNIAMSNTATTRAEGIMATGGQPVVNAVYCTFTGFTVCIGDGAAHFGIVSCVGCRFEAYTSTYAVYVNFAGFIEGCWFNGGTSNSGWGVYANTAVAVSNCIFSKSLGSGIHWGGSYVTAAVFNCTFYSMGQNGVDGILGMLANNIFDTCGTAILNAMSGTQINNAFRANGTIRGGTASFAVGDITLTAVPFTSTAGDDYSLNATAGGGAACKGTGYPGVFQGGLTTAVSNVGAVQSAGAGGGGQVGYPVL